MKVRYYKLFKLLTMKKQGTFPTFAKRLGLLPTEIEKIETNRLPSSETLHAICEALECDIDDMMDIFLTEEDDDVYFNGRLLRKNKYIL